MPEWLREWWAPLALAVTVVLAPLARWGLRSGLASKEDLSKAAGGLKDAIEQQTAGLDARIDELEREHRVIRVRLEALPTREDIHKLAIAMETLAGRIGTLDHLLARIDQTQQRHEAILAEAARRSA
jgi:predicted  nucleic acid-binding Zn-ribbon protein